MSATTPINRIKARTMDVLDWVDNHWGRRRALVSLVGIGPFVVLANAALLGVVAAHIASSPAEIVPLDLWTEFIAPDGGFETPAQGIIMVGIGGTLLTIVDVVGRIVYAHLLWVPMDVWNVVAFGVLLTPMAVLLVNLLWGFSRVLSPAVDPSERGETHG